MVKGGVKPKEGDLRPATAARQIKDGKEVIALRVDWNFRDEHLKALFGELLKWLRQTDSGGGKAPPEPEPEKKGKKSTVLSGDLSKLRAMRLLHHHVHVGQAVIAARRIANQFVSDENLYRDAKAGRAEFKICFPFEGEPFHLKTPSRTGTPGRTAGGLV